MRWKKSDIPAIWGSEAGNIAVYDLESGIWYRIPTGRPLSHKPEIFGNQQFLFIALPAQDKKPSVLLCYDRECCLWTFQLTSSLKKATLSADGSTAYIITGMSLMALETISPKIRWQWHSECYWHSDFIDMQLSDDSTKLYALRLNTRQDYLLAADELHEFDAHSGRKTARYPINVTSTRFFAGFYNNKPYSVQHWII